MISIQHHLANSFSDPDAVLDEKARSVWRYLNKEKCAGTASFVRGKSITIKAQELLDVVKSSSYIHKYSKHAASRHYTFIAHLLANDMLEQLITSRPPELENLVCQLDSMLTAEDFKKIGNNIAFSERLLKTVFNYKTYRDSEFCSSLYIELMFTMATCPYCNEYPVKVVLLSKDKGKKPTLHFDLDHFYPKNEYPFLALSFYNHIPSCKYCNSLHKKDLPFSVLTHTHPYVDNFDSLSSFSYSHRALIGEDVDSIDILNTSSKAGQLCDDLRLRERYKQNIGYAKINQLIRILADNADLFMEQGYGSSVELIRLKMRLDDFGLTHEANRIMEQPWSKMQRDLVKFFDVNRIILNK